MAFVRFGNIAVNVEEITFIEESVDNDGKNRCFLFFSGGQSRFVYESLSSVLDKIGEAYGNDSPNS